jgi:probable rRNA maturation factor
MPTMPQLGLSLQFALQDSAAAHRAALPRHKVARWIRHALDEDAQITVRIVDADEGRALNRDYRHKDYATNVLTFGYGDDTPLSADLVLCAPVVAAEAQQAGKSLQAHYAHLIVHGSLHAQGWDHETGEADAQEMEARETQILAALGFEDPYA